MDGNDSPVAYCAVFYFISIALLSGLKTLTKLKVIIVF